MFMKKTMTAASFTGCSAVTKATVSSPDHSKSYNAVCTILPEYDCVDQLVFTKKGYKTADILTKLERCLTI